MKLNGQGPVELHRRAQDLEREKEIERERFQEKKKKKAEREVHEEIRPDTNKPGTAMWGLEAAAGDELVNRSWERIKPGGNADEQGIGAV